ncbi:MAG: hypothetical protein A3H97_01005 [Acidobacteria bacterium RIFCSPLOWO2_02_FULL_65_29]|nr:MAG: hypothetical protein A3H97_01005 [Acidobacteria bacterium RIFCSPLOWO2_02_FULL_65_29]
MASPTSTSEPYALLAPSKRDARFTASPSTVKLKIVSVPMLPATTIPVLMPMRVRMGERPWAAHSRLSATISRCMASAARHAWNG